MDDLFLIQQTVNGHKDAFKFLVIRYQRPIFSFLNTFSLSSQITHEIAQETFLKAFQSLKSFDSTQGASFSTWLFTIAKNHALNHLSKASVSKEVGFDLKIEFSAEENQQSTLENEEKTSTVKKAIQKLPRNFKNVLILSYFDELSIDEIAQIENCPIGTVKSRLYRGKQLLRTQLIEMLEV